jgi:hypothetical protein
MNYTELKQAVEEYTQNVFTSAEFGTFTRQAEQRIYNSAQPANLRKNVTGVLSTGNKYLSCPADFLSVYSMAIINNDDEYVYLIDKDVNFLREVYPSATETGIPKYYALFGPTVAGSTITDELSFIIAPTPDDPYVVELHYNYYPESMVDATSGRTWLGDNFDSVLLYGVLMEAYIFMKGEVDLMQLYDAKYKEALMLYKALADGKQRGDTYRDGQVKYPVK